ncbi:signal peptidase I SipW [Bacillus sp. OK048]|uniref:signal peptidase I SipW n=1 Tax=Bacillus sp. OK048 TaxID=1882761 RepID=UPI000886F1A0|nr:signal peptidase I [Bacillus sp. OK048]SDL91168.1 signal peptidase, endoplasmic reticulum-type [Bacillus sp. OK048]
MKIVKKILSTLITVILSITLIFMIFVVISSKASGGEPSILGYQLKTVLSGSMEPTFKTGSIIAVKPLENPGNLKKDDIITFIESDEKLITHRIIDVNKAGDQITYVTKGDNNNAKDLDPVLTQNVVAKYSGFTIPYVGYLIDYSKSKNGMALLLILPGILLLSYSGISIYKAIKELDKGKGNDAQGTI